jgi:hypothetical protein
MTASCLYSGPYQSLGPAGAIQLADTAGRLRPPTELPLASQFGNSPQCPTSRTLVRLTNQRIAR